ncbi:hypothetical protein LEP1GSC042_2908 [Leptospira kirschneri serovar Bim str. PUO 1247]|nr:hypothetical protein LEP1GSC042_2908 [Leptospira kirschneri serovar Bim str. PUO 1247]
MLNTRVFKFENSSSLFQSRIQDKISKIYHTSKNNHYHSELNLNRIQ